MKHFAVAATIGVLAFSASVLPVTAMPLSALIDRALHRNEAPAPAPAAPVIKVQSSEAGRIGQLEEQVRSLNGRIEEMSFQLLQMQEQIRKFQEDNEFRFQDLEKGGGAAPKKKSALETPRTQDQASVPATESPAAAAGREPGASASSTTGSEPTDLGQIILDSEGQTLSATANPQPAAPTQPTTPSKRTAALNSDADLYQSAYGHVLSGDYSVAETEFRDYLDSFPKSEKAADASFWMGEAQYSQGKFSDAAKTFLNAHQTYGKSPKAPEMLLKLGMSLAKLDNKETACATLREVTKRYPKASPAVKAKVTSEQSRLAC
ncbi:tol-pal system protein YbgF [Rhizobium rhizosphaerae]|uniref:Cell division coordinator CpoB n=1 Tax=Xaviernesmea rhizosphaerae TaxID=1672749 RepID=A0A1Q9AFD2_9HYPH|nr:tol-pal system protein YbgF [Xaviernesmea rhizosphaerae]OLP53621.1 tol-pal system protein YbgF [Xaviernesmea rhizosphaerae]OQP86338.1 tol-pal system protein YbgF [Xaviernesmea rhizosphaerae]